MASGTPQGIEQIIGPQLCREQPWASEISIYWLEREFPTVEKAQILGGARDDISTIKRILLKDIECKTAGGA